VVDFPDEGMHGVGELMDQFQFFLALEIVVVQFE
jgi:hypothetical protein